MKFDISYLLAKEGITFKKYPALYELEAQHGVNLGFAYKTKDFAKTFVRYIARRQRESFLHTFSTSHFFSFLMDSSTDTGNIEDELIAVMYCFVDKEVQEMRSCVRYYSVKEPTKADARGLIAYLCDAMKDIGLDKFLDKASVLGIEDKTNVVGGGTDGAAVNVVEQRRMKSTMQEAPLPCLFWTWCYSNRLELACKDALSSKLFKDLEEMLLRLYLLYTKSPKKAQELSDIASDLKEVFKLPKGGDMPVRAQGSRWICHKRAALQRTVH